MRFLKEFAGTDYRHSARVNNCSWPLATLAELPALRKNWNAFVRIILQIHRDDWASMSSLCAGSGLFSSHLLKDRLTKTISGRYIHRKYPDAAVILRMCTWVQSGERGKLSQWWKATLYHHHWYLTI